MMTGGVSLWGVEEDTGGQNVLEPDETGVPEQWSQRLLQSLREEARKKLEKVTNPEGICGKITGMINWWKWRLSWFERWSMWDSKF